MNVASLELCKELYGLSLWQPVDDLPNDAATDVRFWVERAHSQPAVKHQLEAGFNSWQVIVPAYDLGYLIRKLPVDVQEEADMSLSIGVLNDGMWEAAYYPHYFWASRTPEDATVKLAIELFKAGILEK